VTWVSLSGGWVNWAKAETRDLAKCCPRDLELLLQPTSSQHCDKYNNLVRRAERTECCSLMEKMLSLFQLSDLGPLLMDVARLKTTTGRVDRRRNGVKNRER